MKVFDRLVEIFEKYGATEETIELLKEQIKVVEKEIELEEKKDNSIGKRYE